MFALCLAKEAPTIGCSGLFAMCFATEALQGSLSPSLLAFALCLPTEALTIGYSILLGFYASCLATEVLHGS